MTKFELTSSAIATCSASPTGIIYYDNRPAGAGKTYTEIEHVIENPGLYIFACDRKAAIHERSEKIRDLLRSRRSSLHVVEIMSSEDEPNAKRNSVKLQVEALPHIYKSGHVLAIITHNALMDADLSQFSGWALVIDETPSVFESLATNSAITWPVFQQHFAIIPGDGLNTIVPATTSLATNAEFARDTMAREISKLHRRVTSLHFHVVTEADSWERLSSAPCWRWTSIWNPASLLNFDRVTFLANAFDRSLTKKIFEAIEPKIEWQPTARASGRSFKPRRMVIRYFARAHSASRGLFDRSVGKKHLGQIAGWIRKEVGELRHIWACNKREDNVLKMMPGEKLPPRMAGSNRYSDIDHISMIYTAKPEPSEAEILKILGVDPVAAKETREFETIYQFVSRCSVRDPDADRPILVHVYDHSQARYLQEMYVQTGYVEVELQPIDLGFLDWMYDGAPGPKKRELSLEELEEKQARARKLARERQRRRRAKLRD